MQKTMTGLTLLSTDGQRHHPLPASHPVLATVYFIISGNRIKDWLSTSQSWRFTSEKWCVAVARREFKHAGSRELFLAASLSVAIHVNCNQSQHMTLHSKTPTLHCRYHPSRSWSLCNATQDRRSDCPSTLTAARASWTDSVSTEASSSLLSQESWSAGSDSRTCGAARPGGGRTPSWERVA